MKIINIKQTCESNPSQWEFILDDGRYGYIRYRWGILRISLGISLSDAIYGYDSDTILDATIGHEYDGTLNHEELFAAFKLLRIEYQSKD